jgi:acyl-CoA reductase-like NAD-dependent aldehyde dehydrogenase
MKKQPIQRDLFAVALLTPVINADQRDKLLPLIEDLLKEVVAGGPTRAREGGDDEDHA